MFHQKKLIEAGGAMQKLTLNIISSWKKSDNYLEKYPSWEISTQRHKKSKVSSRQDFMRKNFPDGVRKLFSRHICAKSA